MSLQINDLIYYLEKKGIEVINHYSYPKDTNKYVIVLEDIFLHYNIKQKMLDVSFNAICRPDHAAFLILILKDNPDIKKIHVMQSHYYDKNNIFVGEEAFNLLEQERTNEVIEQFIDQQKKIALLIQTDCHEC